MNYIQLVEEVGERIATLRTERNNEGFIVEMNEETHKFLNEENKRTIPTFKTDSMRLFGCVVELNDTIPTGQFKLKEVW